MLQRLVRQRIRPLGSKSKRGTEVAALLYSLIETAQLRREDPAVYLQRAAMTAIATPGAVTLPTAAEEPREPAVSRVVDGGAKARWYFRTRGSGERGRL